MLEHFFLRYVAIFLLNLLRMRKPSENDFRKTKGFQRTRKETFLPDSKKRN